MTALSGTKRYQAYPEYKDSGVEWSDTLPLSWGAVKLRWISTIYAGGTPSKTNQSFWENGTVPWINSGAVNQGLITKPSTLITEQAYQNSSAKWIPKGSLVVALAGQGKTKGMVAQLAIDSTCNQSMGAIVPECSEHSRYLYWWITSNYQNIRNMAGGDLRDGLNLEHLGSIQCPQPSIAESVSIANFLDHETAKIDTLIEKQQQLIKLLKEKRQAVISHAVTKGLNPQAPMKDSGVEWLGEVPEHWQVCRLKHIATIQSGIAKGGKDLTGKTLISVPMLRVANVQDGYLKLEDVHSIQIEPHMLERYSLKNGDVLMNEGGDNDKLGRGAIWREQIQNCIHQNHVFAIRTQGIEPEWLDTLTRASYAKFYFFSVAKQSTNLASISATNIKETPILVPSDEEREEILLFLQHQLARFDDLEGKCERQISLLKERRTALISAAVTGKIDVRNWQAPTFQDQAMEQTA